MAEVTSHKPGQFCWFELATNDQNGASSFYSDLFGWNANHVPISENYVYTMMEKNGKQAAAVYAMGPDEQGMPPHWRIYIAVEDVNATTSKAESLGAKIIVPPFDVMEFGKMAAIQDPTGAVFMIWQALQHPGAGVVDEPNSFCWYELNTNDTGRAAEFYTKLFGWTANGESGYIHWEKDGKSIGGMMKIQPEWGPMPPNWMAYVMVGSADDSANKAKSLGGNVMMGPQDIPGTGRFAVMTDPQGAVFATYEPIKK